MMELHYEHQGKQYPVKIVRQGDGFEVEVSDRKFQVESKELKPGFFSMTIDGKVTKCTITTEGNQRHIFIHGDVYRFNKVEAGARPASFDALPSAITSPISGKVTAIGAADNDTVKAGQVIITIEAMKMEYQIKAPYDGKVEKGNFKVGDQVDIGELLVQMEKEA
jgi:3-methylcrotonyl-CoA carboxylase alpha subunit